jgi:hypothetical protein
MGRVIIKNDETKSRLVACFDGCDSEDLYVPVELKQRVLRLQGKPPGMATREA